VQCLYCFRGGGQTLKPDGEVRQDGEAQQGFASYRRSDTDFARHREAMQIYGRKGMERGFEKGPFIFFVVDNI